MQDTQAFQRARMARDARFDGQFFVAVKSTGIFCRPICPAPSPKEENVEYFTVAQLALQAGYRPCLRCRPDSAPDSWAWKGVDTTVERAIKLLRQYPELSLQALSDKLGISDRYLRVLFEQRVGISPKKFRLYDQLLFAKRLLHESTLSVEDVAQASGFSSARRLQENMKKNLALTPSQIRKHTPITGSTIHLQLAFRPPYAWAQVRDFLAMRAIPGMEHVEDKVYRRTFNLDGATGWFSATYREQKRCFDVEVNIDDISRLKRVTAQIRRILDLDAMPEQIQHSLQLTGVDSERVISGIRIPGIWDTFEAGCRAILGQQISVKAAINLVTQLTHRLGKKQEQKFYFPSPAEVAQADLDFLKMPQSRKNTLAAFASHYAQDLTHQVPASWLPVKGIGPWTVAYANMRGLSEPDVWLDTDLVIKKQLQAAGIHADAAKPWRSYLTFQLWSMA